MMKQRDSLITDQSQTGIRETLVEQQPSQPAQPQTKHRFISLDVLRGLTIIGMLFVDDLYPDGPAWIQHARWNGLTLADLIFPSFVFIMGMAVPLALTPAKPFRWRNVARIIGLLAIGVLLNLFQVKFNFNQFRVMGILQRISLCYGALSIIHALTGYGDKTYRYIGAIIAVGCAMVYITFMLTFQNQEIGCTHEKNLSQFCNFGAYWDRRMFGQPHMIYPNDPEGLFTTLTSFINGYAGYLFCLTMLDHKGQIKRILGIWLSSSVLCGLIALPLVWLMPLNKKIWSISYTFLTISISGVSLTFITVLLDVLKKDSEKYQKVAGWITAPLIWFGRNPLAIFISRDFVDDLLNTYIVINGTQAWKHIYHYLFQTWVSNEQLAACMFSTFLLLFFLAQAYILYRNGIFIRL